MNYKRIISLMLSVLICLSSIDFSYANHFSSRPNIQIGNNVAQQTVSEQPNISEIKKDVSMPSGKNKDDNKSSNNNSQENKPGKESQKQTDDSSSVNGTTKNDSQQDKDNKKQDTDKKEKDSSSEKGDLLNSATPNLNDIIQEQIKNNLSIALGGNPNTNPLSMDDSWKEQFKIEVVSGKSEIEIVPNAYQNEYFENLTIQVKMNEQLYQYFKGEITLPNNEEILYYTFLGYGLAKSFRGSGYHESPFDRMFINQDFTDILKEKIQNGDFIKTGEEYLLDLSSRSKLTAFSMREKEYELESWLDPKNKEERYKDYSFSDSKIKIPVTFKKGSYTSEQLQLLENQITLQSAETEILLGNETHFTIRGEIGRDVQDVFFPNSNLKINYSIVVNGEKRALIDLIEIDKIDRYYMIHGMEPIIPRSADVVALNLNRDIASSHNNFLPSNLVYEGILPAGDYEILMEITEEDDATPLVTKKVSVSVKSFKEEKDETLNHLKSGEVFKFIFPSKDSVIQPADSKNRPIRIEIENTKQMVESIWDRQLQPLTEVFIKNTNDKIVVKGKLKKVESGIYTIEGSDLSTPLSYAISFLKEGNYTIEVNYSDDTTGLIQEIVPFVVMDKNSKYIQAIKEKINGEIISYENKYRNLRFKLDKETYQLMIKPTKKFDRMTWLDYRIDIYNEEGNLAHSTRNLKSEIRKSALQGNQEEYFDSIALKASIYNSNPLLKDGKYKAEIVFLYDPYYKSEFVTIGKSKPFEFEINEGQDKFTEDEALKNKILEITAAFTPSITQTHDETQDIYGDIILNDAGIESINQELQKLKAEFTNIYNIYIHREVNIFDENGKSVAFTQSGDGVITLTNPIRFATPTKYKMVAQYFVKINISGKEEQKLTISNLKQDVFVNAIHKQSMSAELEELKKTAEIKIHSSEVRGFEFTAGHKINEPLYQYLQSNSAVFKINYRLQDEDGHSLFLKENYYDKRSYYRFPNASDRLYNCQTEYIKHSLNLKPGTYQIKATLFVQDKENKAYYPIAENMVTQYYSGSNSNEDLFDTLRDKEFKLLPLDKETYEDIDDIEFTTSIDKEVYTKNIKKVIFSNEILVVKLKIGYHYGQVIADKKVEEIHYDSKNQEMPKLTEYKKAIALVDSSSDKVLIKYKIKASEIGAGEHPVEITLGQVESRYTDSEIFKTDSQTLRRVSLSFSNDFLSSRIAEDETPYSITVNSTPLIGDKFDVKLKLYKFKAQTKTFEFEKELQNKFTVENTRNTTYQLRTTLRKNEVGEGISKIELVLQPKNTAFEPKITQTGEFKFKFRSDLQVNIPDITLSKTGEEKEISCEIKDLFGAPEKAEIVVYIDNHEILRKEVSLSPYSYTHLEKIKLPTEQAKEYELKVAAVSKFDNKEYVAKKNYQVEEQSNLTINGQKSAYITPKNIALDIQNDIQIRNNNSLADRIHLEYISEDVEVTGPSELEIQGKSMTYLPISVKPKKDGNHQVKIVATSQNDTTKVYEVSFAVQTREILSNQFMLRLGQGSVSIYENEQLETFVEIINTGDTPISEIKLTATSENTVTAVLENESLNNIAPFETRRMKVTLSASSLSEEYQNNNVIITATGSENVSIRKSIHVQVMKKKGKLLINNGNAIQTVSGGQNEEVRAQIIVSNIGNADLSNLTIQSNDPNVVIEKNSVNVLKPSDSYVFDVKIKAEASAEIGEFQHNVEIKHNGITKGYVTIKHIVTTAQTGTLELVVFDVTGKPFKRGKVKLHHKKLSDVNYELNLQDQKENQVLSQEMKIGEYKLYLLNEKEEKIREMDITILPNLILQQPIQLDIKDKLFNTEFNISKEKTKDGYTINIISASPGAKLPEDVPSIDLGGEIYTLEPGQRRDVNLSVINNSVYNIQNVELEMALLNQIGQQSGTTVQVIIHDPGTINLGPKETKNIPVTIVATANAKIDDETTILVSAKAECTDFKITKAGGSLLFAKTAIGGVVRTTDDVNRPLPSYPNTGGGGIQQIIIDKPQIPNYSPYKKGQTQLNISSQITMDREILKANLRIFEVKEETKLKSVYVHILDKNREEITNKFFQKAYKGEEYTGENTIIPGKEYEIGWYLAENSFFVQESTEFIAFAQIIYEENGQQQIENTQEVTFTLNPLPYLDVEFEMPNYMLANKEYEFKTTIHNVGKGTAKNFNMKTLGSALEKELGLVSLSSDELKNKDIAPNEKVTTVVKMKSTRETAIENRLISWQYQNDLGLDIMPLIKGIRIKVNDEAKRVMQERIKKRNHPDPVSCINDPIDLSSGAQVVDMELLAMDGSLPLQYFISYNSHLRQAASHGNGWTNIFDMKVEKTAEGIDVHYNGVKKNSFVANGDGTYRTGDADRMDDILTEENGEYVITKKDNIKYRFYPDGRLKQVAFKDDKTIDITYDGDNKTIKDTQSGVFITVSMQDGKVTELIDNGGRKVSLTYDDKGNLTQVQNPLGNIMKYEYDDQNRIVRGYDEEGELLFENVYDEMDRIIKQTDALSSEGTSISYEETEKELIAKVTDRLGHIKTYTHDKLTGRLQKLEDEEGLIFERIYDENSRLVEEKDAQASIRYEYDSNGNLTKITDKLGRVTSYTYDDQGNLLTQTTPRQNTTKMTYDDHGKLLSITNPIGDVLKNEYDPKGNLISTTLPNNDKLSYTVENGRVTNVKPKKDSQYTKVYDEFGRVSEIQNPVGGAIKFTYFGDNQIKTITDESGNITKFEYDKRGNLSQITDPLGHTQQYKYNLYKDLVSYTDQEGNQTLYNYDAERNLVMTTYPNKAQTSYRYDVRGNLIKETDALGNVTTYTYDSVGNLIQVQKADRIQTYIYDKAGQLVQSNTDKVTSYTYDEDGNLKTISDANGEKTVVSYDELGRIISVTDKEGHEENYTYDETGLKDYIGKDKQKISYEREYGQITKIIDQEGNEVRYEYDKMGRATKIIDQEGNEHQIDYTPTGQISSITDPYKHAVSYEYDAVGRKIAQIDKNGNKTSFVYSPSGNLIEIQNTLGNKVSFVYDSLGNVIRETDAAGNETIHQYNKAGELIESISPLGNHTLYEYNAFGEVVKVSDSIGTIRTLSYNNKGYLSSEQDADGNTTKYEYNPTGTLSKITEPNGKETLYGYDKEGRLTKTQSGKDKQKATQTYDEAGRIKQIIDPKERSIEFGYDTRGNLITQSEQMAQGTKTTKFTYNAKNLLQRIENAKGQKTNLLYDKLGRVIEQKEEKEKTTYRYDANGNILEVQNSQGVIKREYDALNRVSKVIDQNGDIIRYLYDEVGNLKTLHYPAKENSDAKTVHYTYDAIGNILTVSDWNSRVTSYTYDVRGRETSEQRPNGSTKTITYDASNRILELLDVDAKGNILLRYEMAYDAQGNIIRRTSTDKIQIVKAQTQTYSYNYDQLTNQNGKNISYDAEGNPLSYHSQGKSYALKYDQRNRLIAVGENSYTYDAENARIAKTEEGQTTLYSIDKENGLPRVLKERQGAKTTWYVYGNGLIGQETSINDIGTNLINQQIQSANPKQRIGKAYRSYHYDQQGNTILLTDEQGEVKARYSYDPYGQVLAHQGEDTVYQYSGKYGIQTDQTKLLYMRARYYDPSSKRFLGQDILMGNLSDIRSLNRYAYVEGNPMKYIDPTGMFAEMAAYEHTGYGKWKKPKPTKKNEQKKSPVPPKPPKPNLDWTTEMKGEISEKIYEQTKSCLTVGSVIAINPTDVGLSGFLGKSGVTVSELGSTPLLGVGLAGLTIWAGVTYLPMDQGDVTYSDLRKTDFGMHLADPLTIEANLNNPSSTKKKLKTLEDLIGESVPGRKTKGRSEQYDKAGDYEKALEDFEDLGLSNVRDKSTEEKQVKVGDLSDGKTVTVRDDSSYDVPTLEFQFPNSRKKIKFRYIG